MSEINLGSVSLGEYNADWYKVICKLAGRSVRANTASVIGFYLQRQTEKYEKHLRYTARKHGLSRDECFRRLLNDEPLGEPITDFSEAPPFFDDTEA